MKKADLNFKDSIGKDYSFIAQCLFKSSWETGADEYNKEIKSLLRKAADTDDFVEKYLTIDKYKRSQCYQEMLRVYHPDKVWYYLREMIGDKCRKTDSDAGGLKIGTDNFSIIVPNGHGDGVTRYAILDEKDFYADHHIISYFTLVEGNIKIYAYDCGTDVDQEICGRFQVYYNNGIVVFVKLEK